MTTILIDANNLLFRYGYALKAMRTTDGQYTGAVYGVLQCMLRLKRRYPDAFFVVVWDGEGPTWRHELFPAYKAGRQHDDFKAKVIEQRAILEKIVALIGVPSVRIQGYEADDVIGTLARWARDEHPVIVSGDKDFLQLLRWGVTVISDTKTLKPETARSVQEKFGCGPANLLKVRTVAGDASDGIPGPVERVGTVRAAKEIEAHAQEYDFMRDDPPECCPETWRAVWGDLMRNYKLMRIRRQLDLKCKDVFRERPVNYGGLCVTLGRLELNTLFEDRFALATLQKAK